MKKSAIFVCIMMAVVCVSLCLFSAPVKSNVSPSESKDQNLITLSDTSSAYRKNKAIESRFLNMLNHNFVYGEDIGSVEAIVNNAMPAVLDMRDSADDSFIAEDIISDFVFNMYGVEIEDFSQINCDFPKRQGYVYILPRGYAVYTHEMVAVYVNEDGSYTVKTKVTVDSHDGEAESFSCSTLFVANSQSQFGFNIISSEILSGSVML